MTAIFSFFRISSTEQLKSLINGFGHFLPAEQKLLINAIINEIDKGKDMNKEALGQAAAYLSAGIGQTKQELRRDMGEEGYASLQAQFALPETAALHEQQTADNSFQNNDEYDDYKEACDDTEEEYEAY